jgi:hypothetical protein
VLQRACVLSGCAPLLPRRYQAGPVSLQVVGRSRTWGVMPDRAERRLLHYPNPQPLLTGRRGKCKLFS